MYSNAFKRRGTNYLDRVRQQDGAEKLKDSFNRLIENDKEKALNIINSGDLMFPSLFILQSDINKNHVFANLNRRNKLALEITERILLKNTSESKSLSQYDNRQNYPVLKWMLQTGYSSDGLNAHYDEVLDKASILLSKVYKDCECLRYIEKVIFTRYNKGSFIYDLVWAFFESGSSDILHMLSKRLLSDSSKDVELARKLLGFIPCFAEERQDDNVIQYCNAVKWINDNIRFLYYTGEHFLQTARPCQFKVSLELKYLQRAAYQVSQPQTCIPARNGLKSMENFRKLDSPTQKLLADFSNSLHKNSQYDWNKWIKLPLQIQIEAARKMGGGIYD